MLQPFGAGNPQPLFLTCGVRAIARREFGEDCLEVTLEDASGRAAAVRWPSAKMLDPHFANGSRSDIIFHVEPDAYAASGIRLTLVDARNSTDA